MKLISVMIWFMLISGVWLSSVQSPMILTETEQAALQTIYERGKLAHDVALKFYEAWESPIFKYIAENEQAQLDALDILLTRYDLEQPSALSMDKNIAQGQEDMLNALETSAQIEETTIQHLQQALAAISDRKDITDVYEELLRGSRNHLRVLVRTLETQHISYSPKVLDPASFNVIVTSDQER